MNNTSSLLIVALLSASAAACTKSPAPADSDLVLASASEPTLKSHAALLPFPEEVRRDSLQARFLTVFIVDTAGAVDTSSVRFVSETRAPFRHGVCEYLAATTYQPVRRDGRPRRAVVIEEFRYMPRGNIPTTEPAGQRFDSARASIAGKGVSVALAELASAPRC